jgi:DNA helicase TIP49 (TBP-interacting protein)
LKKPDAPANIDAEAQKLQQFASLSVADQAAVLTNIGHAIKEHVKTEVSAGGAKVALGQLILDTIHKLENNSGTVSNDLRVQALAYNLANATYKLMK